MDIRILLRGGMVVDGIGDTIVRADALVDGPVIAGMRVHASYEAQKMMAGGVDLVIVNGSIVWRTGELADGIRSALVASS